MSDIQTLQQGDVISFSLVVSGVITDEYTNVIYDSTVGYDVARSIDTSIPEKHANLYPFFKDKVSVNSPKAYNYIAVKLNTLTNKLAIIGIPWIQESTLKNTSTESKFVYLINFEESKRPALETFLKNANIAYVFSDTPITE